MAFSYALKSGNGSTTAFTVDFPYLDKTHVGVKVNGVVTTFSWLTGSTISITPAPVSGAIIEIRRVTPKNAVIVDFVDGSVLLEAGLDKTSLFNLYLAQEAYDATQQAITQNSVGVWDGQARRATNFADPTGPQDLVTKGYFDNTYGASIAASVASAAASASSASTSATSAADSATQANNFRLRYQGALSSAPTTRYDGSAIQVGDLYFDIPGATMKVYNGVTWTSASSSVNGIRALFRYVATAGQTTFSGADTNGMTLSYNVGFTNVYLNGIRLDQTDFTATNGTTIVLAAGASAGAELNIETFGAFTLASFSGSAIQDATVTGSKLVNATYTSIDATVASNALTLTLKAPLSLMFRNPSLTNGSPVAAGISSDLSLVVPSGATLGMASGQAGRLALVLAYNGGSPVLCVTNMAGGINLDETDLISPTTISGSSNSASVIYSASAVAANSPYRVVGFIDISEVTAGTWASAALKKQGIGGQSLASLASLGYGQTWQQVTRTSGVTYWNTSGKPIVLKVNMQTATAGVVNLTINGTPLGEIVGGANTTGTQVYVGTVIIPAWASYSLTESGSVTARSNYELR